jgi:hypothetical protein
MQTRVSKEFNVNAICVDVGLSCGEAAQVPGCMKRRREEEKKRRREEETKRRRQAQVPFVCFSVAGLHGFLEAFKK